MRKLTATTTNYDKDVDGMLVDSVEDPQVEEDLDDMLVVSLEDIRFDEDLDDILTDNVEDENMIESDENVRPVFVIIPGPHQSGTKSFQSALCGMTVAEQARKVLLKDGFEYIGTGDHRGLCTTHHHRSFMAENLGKPSLSAVQAMVLSYPNQTTIKDVPKLTPSFVQKVEALRKERRNGMIVFEDWSRLVPSQVSRRVRTRRRATLASQ
jgi:hypothetical protein